jgi:hypothetical protein
MYTIYRLEHKRFNSHYYKNNTRRISSINVKVGPYCTVGSSASHVRKNPWFSDMIKEHMNPQTHPSMGEDGLSWDIVSQYFCACKTIDELKAWFGQYLELFLEGGFVIAEYTVNHFVNAKSDKQCFFNTDAIILRKHLVD